VHNKVIEALGAVPLSMSVSEMYDALERGVVNGTISASSVLTSFNLAEIVRYAANARFTVSTFFVTMNKSRWESLSAEDQRVLEEASGAVLAQRAAIICDATDTQATQAAQARGVLIYDLAAHELERWKTITREVPEHWVRGHATNPLAARQILDRLVQLAQTTEARHA
jgi:TRAP-type C4-dicarboxylate transport system substrate-binding protein